MLVDVMKDDELTWGWAPLLVDDDDAIGLVTSLDDDDEDGDITDGTNKEISIR